MTFRRAFAKAVILLGSCVLAVGCDDAESEAKVAALELTDVAAYWAVRGQDQERNNYIHPVVRFRVLNGGDQPVGYIQVMAVFKRESFPDEPWGNAFVYSISDEPIPPGSTSDLLTLRSDTNVVSKDAPEQMFENEKWERVFIEVFLRVGSSNWRPLLDLEAPKRIGAPGLEKFLEPDSEDAAPGPPA